MTHNHKHNNHGNCNGTCNCNCKEKKQETTNNTANNTQKPDLSAQDIHKINTILGDIDTDEGLENIPDDINDEDIKKIGSILFGEEGKS